MHAFEENAQFDDNSSVQPVLSVVVIGRNEGQRLARCFESIARIKTVGVKEVIYVDSASTDCSAELAPRYGALSITIHPERPTAAVARNTGWRRAASDLILFLDGDTVLHSEFPRVAYDAMSMDESIAAVWGHRREMHPERSSSIEFSTSIGYIGPVLPNSVVETCLCVASRSWRREGLMTG